MNYTVSAKDLSQITLNETDHVASILQNVAIILKTWQGSSPLYRNFGLRGQFVDKPIPVAMPLIIAEVTEAVSTYETRASVASVSFETDKDNPGKLIPTVEVEISDE